MIRAADKSLHFVPQEKLSNFCTRAPALLMLSHAIYARRVIAPAPGIAPPYPVEDLTSSNHRTSHLLLHADFNRRFCYVPELTKSGHGIVSFCQGIWQAAGQIVCQNILILL
jgi:hypothetical protein